MGIETRISKDLGIDPGYIINISRRNDLYKKYYIKKKNGGKREILQPSKELKIVQSWLTNNIFEHFNVSEYSYAYSRGDSIKKNAGMHCDANYLFHTDISDFFPSINRDILSNYFKDKDNKSIVDNLMLSEEDIQFILDICLYRGRHLVVGSVASPRISNMIMNKFDNDLYDIISGKGEYIYTRYADDITISSKKYIDKDIKKIVEHELNKNSFLMNYKKTYFSCKKDRREVTGVVIDNNTNALTLGNKKYKRFERILYNYLVKNNGDAQYIKGYLSYIKDLNRKQYEQLEKIYIKYDKKKEIFT